MPMIIEELATGRADIEIEWETRPGTLEDVHLVVNLNLMTDDFIDQLTAGTRLTDKDDANQAYNEALASLILSWDIYLTREQFESKTPADIDAASLHILPVPFKTRLVSEIIRQANMDPKKRLQSSSGGSNGRRSLTHRV